MILATTNLNNISTAEISKLHQIYGNMGKRIDEKIIQSLCARYLCHIILENNIKCSGDGFVDIKAIEIKNTLNPIVKRQADGSVALEEQGHNISMSHSGKGVLCGISTGNIGADIQIIKSYNQKIAKRYFSEQENQFICNSGNKDEAFSLIWSFKESIFKSGFVDKNTFWKNSQDETFSVIGESGIRDRLGFMENLENELVKPWIITRINEDFVITAICEKKEAILLAI
ncbi:MAG: 4'-phosphopantetheinyl transferase superfamily protein [Oscillospiraceae bacterium]